MDLRESNRRITYHAGSLSILTAISRLLGLSREIIIAYLFGAGTATDAFFVAFRLPNLLRRLFAEGAITVSFIPIFARYLRKKGDEDARAFANSAFTLISIILVIITIIGIIFASGFVYITAPGFYKIPEKFSLTVSLTRLMFPFIFSIGLVALFSGILNTYNHFITPALAPIFLNLSIIAGTFIFYSAFTEPVYSLAIGVLIGSVVQLVVQIPPLLNRGYRFKFVLTPVHPGVKESSRLFVPAVFGAAVYQINLLVTTFLASFLSEGSVAFLWYAGRFFELPLGIFAVSVAVVSLPNLSLLASENRMVEWKSSVNYGLALTFFITIPSMLGLMVFVEPIIKIFYQMGKFTSSDTVNTASALFYYAPGLWAVGGSRIIVQAFYSLKDTRTPVKIAALTFVFNLLFSILLMTPMQHNGLALATTLASMFNFFMLIILLRKKVGPLGFKSLLTSIIKTLIASGIMTMVLYYFTTLLSFNVYSRFVSAGILLGLIFIGILVFSAVAYLVNSSELRTIIDTYFRKRGN
jgi:putative peptidoglycan lipid II flippase